MDSNNDLISNENLEEEKKKMDLYNQLSYLFDSKNNCFLIHLRSVYRLRAVTDFEGDLKTKVINGAFFIFNPKNGIINVNIIHRNEYKGLLNITKHTVELTKNKLIKFISSLKGNLPVKLIADDYKLNIFEEIIENRKYITEEINSIEYEKLKINVNFNSIFNIKRIKDIIEQATESSSFEINLYDNWLTSVSSYTAFSRLYMILMIPNLINSESGTSILLKYSKEKTLGENIDFLWPSYSKTEWIEVEALLTDFLIRVVKPINISILSNKEKRYLLFTSEI